MQFLSGTAGQSRGGKMLLLARVTSLKYTITTFHVYDFVNIKAEYGLEYGEDKESIGALCPRDSV